MRDIYIGIDLGNTNTSIAYMRHNNNWNSFSPECFDLGRSETIRTVITYKDEINYWIGEEALVHSYEYPRGYIDSLKRHIVNGTLKDISKNNKSDVSIIADYFSKIINIIESQIPYDARIEGVAIGVPIGFKDKDKELYLRSMIKAGIYNNYDDAKLKTIFVSEPIAAVLNYNLELKDDKKILVFDFGGGSLDLVIMEMKNVNKSNEVSPLLILKNK